MLPSHKPGFCEKPGFWLGSIRKDSNHFFGNGARTARLRVHKDPVRFTFDQNFAVGFADEFVLAERAHAADAFDPCADFNLLAREGRQEILDQVRARHPGRTDVLRGGNPADGRVMLDGDVLHPLNIGHVVDVPVFINDR